MAKDITPGELAKSAFLITVIGAALYIGAIFAFIL